MQEDKVKMSVSKQMSEKRVFLGSLLALFATIVWAGNFIAAKKLVPYLSAYEINFWRWVFATITLLPVSLPHIKKDIVLVKKDFKLFVFFSFFGCFLSNLFFYNAPKTAPAIDMTILMTTSSIFIMLFAKLLFHDKISKKWFYGSLLAFLGVVILVTKGNYNTILKTEFTEGHFWTLACATCFALYSVCMRLFKSTIHLTVFLQVLFTMATIFSFFSVIIGHGSFHFNFRLQLDMLLPMLYIGIFATVLAFLFWNSSIKMIGPVRAGIIYYLVPVFGSIFAVIFLDETISYTQILGGTLVLGGILFSTLNHHKSTETKEND